MNQDQINAVLLALFASSGPVAKLLVSLAHMDNDTIGAVMTLLTILTPLVSGGVFAYLQRDAGKVAAVATMSAQDQQAALNKVPDEAKVLIAKAVPDVATVVVKDTATNGIAKLAADPAQPHIVTESQNQVDALQGTK